MAATFVSTLLSKRARYTDQLPSCRPGCPGYCKQSYNIEVGFMHIIWGGNSQVLEKYYRDSFEVPFTFVNRMLISDHMRKPIIAPTTIGQSNTHTSPLLLRIIPASHFILYYTLYRISELFSRYDTNRSGSIMLSGRKPRDSNMVSHVNISIL
jgi:hypothetical protein